MGIFDEEAYKALKKQVMEELKWVKGFISNPSNKKSHNVTIKIIRRDT